eukprot:361080-Chlamydomonas_euryale.AAC.2
MVQRTHTHTSRKQERGGAQWEDRRGRRGAAACGCGAGGEGGGGERQGAPARSRALPCAGWLQTRRAAQVGCDATSPRIRRRARRGGYLGVLPSAGARGAAAAAAAAPALRRGERRGPWQKRHGTAPHTRGRRRGRMRRVRGCVWDHAQVWGRAQVWMRTRAQAPSDCRSVQPPRVPNSAFNCLWPARHSGSVADRGLPGTVGRWLTVACRGERVGSCPLPARKSGSVADRGLSGTVGR